MKITRRHLFLGGLGACVTALGARYAFFEYVMNPRTLLAKLRPEMIDAEWGQELLKGAMRGQSRDGIFTRLLSKLPTTNSADMPQIVADVAKQDYYDGRVVIEKGWVVPETLADLSALAALEETKQ